MKVSVHNTKKKKNVSQSQEIHEVPCTWGLSIQLDLEVSHTFHTDHHVQSHTHNLE